MFAHFHGFLLNIHVFAGALALVLFWVPVAARKGSTVHRRAGDGFARAMYVVTATGLGASVLVLADPLAIRDAAGTVAPGSEEAAALARASRLGALFLLMLSLLVLASVRQGVLALAARHDLSPLRTPGHLALLASVPVAGGVTGAFGIGAGSVLLMAFAGISFVAGGGMLLYAWRGSDEPNGWLLEHLRGLLGAGIGAYTAFFVFGGSRVLGEVLTGNWMLLPWLAPTVVGTVLIRRYSRRYRRDVGSVPERDPAGVAREAQTNGGAGTAADEHFVDLARIGVAQDVVADLHPPRVQAAVALLQHEQVVALELRAERAQRERRAVDADGEALLDV